MSGDKRTITIMKEDQESSETITVAELAKRAETHVSEWVGKRTDTGRLMLDIVRCLEKYAIPGPPACVTELVKAAHLSWLNLGGDVPMPEGSVARVFSEHMTELREFADEYQPFDAEPPAEEKPSVVTSFEVPPKVAIERDDSGKAKIVVLHTKTDQQRSACVAKLAALLEEAKDGSMRDVLIISFRRGDEVTLHWTEQTDENGLKFVGALHVRAHLLTSRMKMNSRDGV